MAHHELAADAHAEDKTKFVDALNEIALNEASAEIKTIFISSELFFGLRDFSCFKAVEGHFSEIVFLLYLRDHQSFYKSSWSQQIHGYTSKCDPFNEWLYYAYSPYSTFATGIRRLEGILGVKSRLMLRAYDRNTLKDCDIISDVLHILATEFRIDLDELSMQDADPADNRDKNISISGNLLHIKRMLNTIYGSLLPESHADDIEILSYSKPSCFQGQWHSRDPDMALSNEMRLSFANDAEALEQDFCFQLPETRCSTRVYPSLVPDPNTFEDDMALILETAERHALPLLPFLQSVSDIRLHSAIQTCLLK